MHWAFKARFGHDYWIMAWRWRGNKPSPESVLTKLPQIVLLDHKFGIRNAPWSFKTLFYCSHKTMRIFLWQRCLRWSYLSIRTLLYCSSATSLALWWWCFINWNSNATILSKLLPSQNQQLCFWFQHHMQKDQVVFFADKTHYNDVRMSAMVSYITSLTIVYSTVYTGADHRKHQSSALLVFVREIHRLPVNSPHKGPVTCKMFPFDDVNMGTGFIHAVSFIYAGKFEPNEENGTATVFQTPKHTHTNICDFFLIFLHSHDRFPLNASNEHEALRK